MLLEIKDSKHILKEDFYEWLLLKIKDRFLCEIDKKSLERWDTYFNSEFQYRSIYLKRISSYDICLQGISNLKFNKLSESVVTIFINPNINVPGLDRVRINTACKTINYGVSNIKGYPIFTNIFNHFSQNILTYFDIFMLTSNKGEM